MDKTQLENIGESALDRLSQRSGFKEIIDEVKVRNPYLWDLIKHEVGESAYYAVRARQEAQRTQQDDYSLDRPI